MKKKNQFLAATRLLASLFICFLSGMLAFEISIGDGEKINEIKNAVASVFKGETSVVEKNAVVDLKIIQNLTYCDDKNSKSKIKFEAIALNPMKRDLPLKNEKMALIANVKPNTPKNVVRWQKHRQKGGEYLKYRPPRINVYFNDTS